MRRKLTTLTSILFASTVAACVAAPSTAEQRKRLDGVLYVVPGGFVVNLQSGHTAMVSVALVLTAESKREWLTGVEQARVGKIVSRVVEGFGGRRLVSARGRRAFASSLEREILSTGLPVESVLIPDLAVN